MNAADILGGLLRVNLAAGAAILVVVALRKLVRPRFGARLAYGLWLLPVLAGAAVTAPARQILIVRSAAPAFAATSSVQRAVLAAPSGAAASLDPLMLLVGLWLVGALGAALIMAYLQHRFMRQAAEGAVGPAVVGVIAPRIVTPRDFAERYSPGEQALVLAHERAHIARQDSRLNGLCAIVQCLCWFNPLVHLAARLMRIDQELACDEAVVRRFPGARRAYAEVLVKAQLAILLLPLGCYWPSKSEHPLVERVAMLKQRDVSRARRSAGAAALAVLCAGVGLAAWAAQPAEIRFTAPKPERIAARGDLGAQATARPSVAPKPAETQPASDAATPITLARNEASPAPDRADGETDSAPSPPAFEPLRPGENLKVSKLSLASVADAGVSKASLIRVSDEASDTGQPLGPGHYVERSGLKASGDCSTRTEWYTLSTRSVAPGHTITNFRYELRGDERCDPRHFGGWDSTCDVETDKPDKKTVWFVLHANGDNCFSYGAFYREGSVHDGEVQGATSQRGAVTHSEMVISYDVQ